MHRADDSIAAVARIDAPLVDVAFAGEPFDEFVVVPEAVALVPQPHAFALLGLQAVQQRLQLRGRHGNAGAVPLVLQ